MDPKMLIDDRIHDAKVASRMWAAISTLDLSIIKNWRPKRLGAYDEDYLIPLNTGAWLLDGVIHITHALDFCAHPTVSTANNRIEVIYRPPAVILPEEVCVLRGETTAGVKFAFQYNYAEDAWYDYGRLATPAEPLPATREDVNAVFGRFVDFMKDDRSSHFDPQILDAVSTLPLPIAEQVAWYLAPPSLEDGLLRRGLTNP